MHKGFSLVELMVTVAIVGILSTIAFPAYMDYVLRAKLTDADVQLSSGRTQMEQYYQDNRIYNCAGFTPSASQYFTFSCVVANGGNSYTLTANGINASPTAGFTFTIDESNNKQTTAVPPGWLPSGTCWITKKGGAC